jgi:hypothetical protein
VHFPGGAFLHTQQDRVFGHGDLEFITFMPTPPDFIAQMTAAVVWLASVPAPPNHVIGPLLGGGLIRHGFFKESRAPLRFSSVEALERYITKVRPGFYFLEHPPFAYMQSGLGAYVVPAPVQEDAISRPDTRRSFYVQPVRHVPEQHRRRPGREDGPHGLRGDRAVA